MIQWLVAEKWEDLKINFEREITANWNQVAYILNKGTFFRQPWSYNFILIAFGLCPWRGMLSIQKLT